MDDSMLPPELEQLERDLIGRPRPVAPADLQRRVINVVRDELGKERIRAWWGFAAAMAASILLWLNLSLSATSATDYQLRVGVEQRPVQVLAEQIRQLVPEISEREVLRHALLLQAGSTLARRPELSGYAAVQLRLSNLNGLTR